MGSENNNYTNKSDNESIVEYSLTYFSSDEKRKYIGLIDFQTPSRVLLEKESSDEEQSDVREDANDCARKIHFLKIAQAACMPGAIARKNANASQRIYAALKFRSIGEKQKDIGHQIGKDRKTISRYAKRFIKWSEQNRKQLSEQISPDQLIAFCEQRVTTSKSLHDVLDDLRITLADLVAELIHASTDPSNHESEVFLEIERFQKSEDFNIAAMLEAF